MSGIMGSGKTEYIKNCRKYSDNIRETATVSRDEIRFCLLQEGEDYFAYEKEVFNKFVEQTQQYLNNEKISTIFADATFLTDKSRNKFLNRLKITDAIEIKLIIMDTSLHTCLKRNTHRYGRAKVPETAIIEAWERMERTTGIERINETIVKWGEK